MSWQTSGRLASSASVASNRATTSSRAASSREVGVPAQVSDQEHRVHLARAEERPEDSRVGGEVLLSGSRQVDRIRGRRRRGQVGCERLAQLFGQRRQLEYGRGRNVSSDHTGTAAVADDRDSASAGPRRREQKLCGVD